MNLQIMFPVKSSAEQCPLLSKHPSSEEKHILLPGSVFQVKHILQLFSSVISPSERTAQLNSHSMCNHVKQSVLQTRVSKEPEPGRPV